jgi:hypothetical protein
MWFSRILSISFGSLLLSHIRVYVGTYYNAEKIYLEMLTGSIVFITPGYGKVFLMASSTYENVYANNLD